MQYYLLLGLACLLGGVRLVFNKLYVNKYGSGMRSALWFTFLSCACFVILMLAIGQKLDFSWFSFALALCFAVINVACTVFGFLTLSIGNVSTYTLVLQLGGMVIPFLYGVTLGGEDMTWQKGVCLCLILLGLWVNMEKKEDKTSSRKAFFYYGLLFLLNGAACIVLSVHQTTPTPFGARAVDSTAFTLLYMIFTSLLALLAVSLLRWREGPVTPTPKRGPDILLSLGYGVFYGIANLLIALCLLHVDASAQFPIVTGGSIVVAGLVGLFFREKITWRFVFSTALVLAGTLVLLPWEKIFA